MGRIRFAALSLASVGLLLGAAQEGHAQSPNQAGRIKPADPTVIVRLPQPRPTPARRSEIFFCQTPDTSCRTTQDTFQIEELRDLFVFVTWPGVLGQHIQTVDFVLPDGNIYFSKRTRFSVGGNAPVAFAEFKNQVGPTPPAPHLMTDANKVYPEGIPTLLMQSRGETTILTVLPVAGTYITQRSLTGTWHVRVSLDDRSVLDSEFTIVPSQAPAAASGARTEEGR
jgi:hypothetical protein